MEIGTYIMALEPISTAYFIHRSRQSVCLYVYPSFRCQAKLGKKFSQERIIVIGAVLYAVRVVSKEVRLLVLPRPSCSLFPLDSPTKPLYSLFPRVFHVLRFSPSSCICIYIHIGEKYVLNIKAMLLIPALFNDIIKVH
jgi:hypothetical protein